jgi:DNA polymerase
MTELTDVTVDFETYFDTEYSLRKLMTAEYIHSPKFEVIGVSVKIGDAPARWFSGTHEQTHEFLASIDWPNARVVAHNALFDGSILEWKFGFRPAKYFCTMMGSRPHVVPHTGSMSLENVARYLDVGEKGHEVENHKGRQRVAFSTQQLADYGEYCKQDVNLCFAIGKHLQGILPADEQDLIDLTIKKFTRPVLKLDIEAIEDRITYMKLVKAAALESVNAYGATLSSIRSRPKFIETLKKLGVTVSTKIVASAATGVIKETAALSKKDPEFLALLTHPDEAVRALVAAKIELGSTIEESRLARFKRLYHAVPGHLLPVPLLYYGAHPGRFSGLDSLNLQNLPRPKATDTGRAALRKSIVAPDGYMLIAADFSNIEARIVATLARQWDLVEAFRRGDDVYSLFASRIYGRQITKADKIERFVGKTCILGLGYGMGATKLQLTMATADTPVVVAKSQAYDYVNLYRTTYPNIPALWGYLGQLVEQHVMAPSSMYVWSDLIFTKERIVLPNGMPLMYPDLQMNFGEMDYGGKKLWGGSITENIVQALARIVATRAELRLARAGLRAVHQAHDELIFCVPEEHVDVCEKAIERIMTDPVPWMPRLPVAVEIHHGPTYGDCK